MTSAPASSNRWFAIAVLFLIVNTLGVILFFARSDYGGSAGPRAELVSPADNRIEGRMPLRWSFGADMVAPHETGRVDIAGLLTILPPVNGELAWTRTRELTFQPAGNWPPCQEFNALLSGSLRSLDGRLLPSPALFQLATAPLTLLNARQTDLRNNSLKLRLVFNDLVSGPEAASNLSVLAMNDKPLPFKVEGSLPAGDGTNYCLQLAVEGVSTNAAVTVLARKGMRGNSGPLAMESDTRLEVPLKRELVFEQMGAVTAAFEDGAIRLVFNHPLDLNLAPAFIGVTPAVPFTMEPAMQQTGMANSYFMRGGFKPGAAYTVTLRKGLKGEAGLVLEKDEARTVYFENAPASAEIRASGQYASSRGSRLLPLRIINVRNCRARISRVFPNNLAVMINHQNRYPYYYPEEGLSKTVAEVLIAKETPLNSVVESSLELGPALDGLQGAFAVEIVSDAEVHARTLLVLSDTGITVKWSGNDLLAWVNSIKTLAAISNATVQVWSAENQLIASGPTDSSGLVLFPLDPASDPGAPAVIVVKNGEDISFLNLQGSRIVIRGDEAGSGNTSRKPAKPTCSRIAAYTGRARPRT